MRHLSTGRRHVFNKMKIYDIQIPLTPRHPGRRRMGGVGEGGSWLLGVGEGCTHSKASAACYVITTQQFITPFFFIQIYANAIKGNWELMNILVLHPTIPLECYDKSLCIATVSYINFPASFVQGSSHVYWWWKSFCFKQMSKRN